MTTSHDEKLTCTLVAELARARGMGPANAAPGGRMYIEIGDGWIAAVNGTRQPTDVEYEGCMDGRLEAFEIGFWHDGWWAGALRPYVENGLMCETGLLAAGSHIHEGHLRAALICATEVAGG